MDMNNPKKRSFSSSGLPQDLNRVIKRKKKPSKSKLKGKSSTPAEEIQTMAGMNAAKSSKPKSSQREKDTKKEKPRSNSGIDATNETQLIPAQQLTTTQSVKHEPALTSRNAQHAGTRFRSSASKKSTPTSLLPVKARSGSHSNSAGLLKGQKNKLMKERRLAALAAAESKPGALIASGTSPVQATWTPLEKQINSNNLSTAATNSSKKSKDRKKAANNMDQTHAESDRAAGGVLSANAEDFQMDWDRIEQNASQYLQNRGIDWDHVTPEQRQQLEARYIGRPSMMLALESTVDHSRSASDAPGDSSSGFENESSDDSAEEVSATAHAETSVAKDTVARYGETSDGPDDSSSSSEGNSDSGDGNDHDNVPSVPTETPAALAGAHIPSELSSLEVLAATVAENSLQQPPAVSLEVPRPTLRQTREQPPASPRIAGSGAFKPLQERRLSSVPTTTVTGGSLADTQAKFQRFTAALKKRKDEDSSDDSSSSSESESNNEPSTKPVMRRSVAESFADRMPASHKEGPAEQPAPSDTSSDEEMEDEDAIVDQTPHDLPHDSVAAGIAEDMPDRSDRVETAAESDDNTGSASHEMSAAPAEDSSSASSSSEDSSDEEEPEAAIQAQAVSTPPMSTAQDNDAAFDDSSDEGVNDQGVNVDLSSSVSASVPLAEASDTGDADDTSAMSGVAVAAAKSDEQVGVAPNDDPAVPAVNRSSPVSSSSSDEDPEDEPAALVQVESVATTGMPVSPEDVAQSSSDSSEDDDSSAEDEADEEDQTHHAVEPLIDSTMNELVGKLSTNVTTHGGHEENSDSGSDASEDEAVADQESPSVHDVTEAESPYEAVSAHRSELESKHGNEIGDGNQSEDFQDEADDAPDFVLNENGDIVLAPASSVADNAMSDVEEVEDAAGGAQLEEEDELSNEELPNEEMDEVASADEEIDDEQANDKNVNEDTDEEFDDAHELMHFGSTKPEKDKIHNALATKSAQGEEEPTTVVQSAEESSPTQLAASQRQEAAGIRSVPSQSSTTANVVIKRTKLSQDRSQDLGGIKSGRSQDPPAQASNEIDGLDSSPIYAPVFTEIDSQEAASLIESVSNSVFADTRPLPEGEDSYIVHPQVHIESRLMTEPGSIVHDLSSLKQAPPNGKQQPTVRGTTPLHHVPITSSLKPQLFDTDSGSSEDDDSDDMDDIHVPTVSGTHFGQSDRNGDIRLETRSSMRNMRDRTSVASTLPPEVQAAIAMAIGTPQTTSARKRKMTGNTSTHFSTPTSTRPKPSLAERAASIQPLRHDVPSTTGDVVASTPPSVPKKKSPAKKTGTVSEHFITDRVDLYNTTAGMRRKIPAGQSANPCPPLDSPMFGIIQERTCHEPFWLIMATVFLNKTTGRQAAPTFWKVREKWSKPAEVAAADYDSLFEMIKHLGFQTQRTKRLKRLAAAWEATPPVAGKRYRTLHYPCKGDGKQIQKDQIITEDADDCAGALEIGHIPGCGAYAYDSWRIFCRDILRGVATDYLGANNTAKDGEVFEAEWKRVLPGDKELRACLRWMWLKEGFVWDPMTGEKRVATEEEIAKAKDGDMDFNDVMEAKFAAQATGQDVSSPEKAKRGGDTMAELVVDTSFADIGIPHAPPLAQQKVDEARATRVAQVQVTRQAKPEPEVVSTSKSRAKRRRSPSVEIDEMKSSPVVQKTTTKKKKKKKKKKKVTVTVPKRKLTGPALDSDGLV